MTGAQLAIVVNAKALDGAVPTYELALASDLTPELTDRMRTAFARKGRGRLRVLKGPFGDLNLVNVTAAHIDAALAQLSQQA